MNAELLLREFHRISEAPDAIPRLRRFILDLAVRGKLVDQYPHEEPAQALIGAIIERKRPPDFLNGESGNAALSFPIPANWSAVLAGKILDLQYGKALPSNDRIPGGGVPVYGSNGIVGHCNAPLTQQSTIIIGRKGSAGALNICNGASWTTDVAYYLVPPPCYDIYFLSMVLESLNLESFAKGVKPGLNRTDVYKCLIIVPPLKEQRRIKTKFKELLALSAELATAQAHREVRRDKLVTSSLHRLSDAANNTDRSSFEESARFYFKHLPRLATRPEHIQQLRQIILNLAVIGRLTSQFLEDGRGENLLEAIAQEKIKLLHERGIERQQEAEFSSCSAKIPQSWAFARVADVAIVRGGKRLPIGTSFAEVPTPHIYIRVTNMKQGTIIGDDLRYITPEARAVIKQYTINKEDLYITIAGTIGAVGRIPARFDGHNLTENAAKLVFRGLNSEFFFMALSSDWVQEQFREKTKQMAQPKLALKRIAGTMFPLPPLAEQERIVCKYTELMAVCDAIESKLISFDASSRILLQSTLHQALSSVAARSNIATVI